jgi:protein-S-isoprenylcysteine O-methyltransferase Ste14
VKRRTAALGSALFFAAAPSVVAGAIPWTMTGWVARPGPMAARLVGAALIVVALPVLVSSFARFAFEGRGTPAPIAPTERLVVGGAYRFTRNPMYLAVVSCIAGQALVLWQPRLFGYAAVVLALMAGFVWIYEEPTLRKRYGEDYDAYRRAVPAWWIRLRPWTPPAQSDRRLPPVNDKE